MIPFNKPYLSGKELAYINESVQSGKISGDGMFTQKCHDFFERRFGFKKALLTTSCTHALEMAAILIDIQPGDEVIIPSYTFVSTANAFQLRGARIIFADSRAENPNMDASLLEALITPKTKAIVAVHYAGISCNMDTIMALADKYKCWVVEDAAHAIDSYFKKKPLGGIGHLAAFSFHETKNIMAGEGGMLAINDDRFIQRAEIIREKGTNRSQFFRGEIDKYGWVDIGSSYLPSDIIAAFLFAQLEQLEAIQQKRMQHWNNYYTALQGLTSYGVQLPYIDAWATNNAHMFYMVCKHLDQRNRFIQYMKDNQVWPVFHYISLHSSSFFSKKHDGRPLPYCDHYSDCLVRLPLYYELSETDTTKIATLTLDFFSQESNNSA